MNASSLLWRASAQSITTAAAEAHDLDELAPTIQAVVEQVADRLDDRAPLNPQPLRDAGLDDDAIARLLRSILFEGAEALRAQLEPSLFAEAVLSLRACMHPAIPRPQVAPEDREFYRRLLEGDAEELQPEYRRLLRLYQDLTLAWPDIVYVHDLNGMMLYVNRPGLELTRFTVADVLGGLSIYDLVAPEFVDLIEARMESPGAVSRTPYSSEICAKDGERIPIEIATRILRTDGRIDAILGIARDLRLVRRLETEIRRSNVYIDTIVATVPVGIILTDGQGVVLEANPAAVAMLGAPDAHALTGDHFHHVFEDDPDAVHDLLIDVLAKGRERRLCAAQATTFGAALRCNLIIAPLHEESGGVDSLLVLMADLSAERGPALAQAPAALAEAVRNVVHEFNNPLTAIFGYTQLLLNAELEPVAQDRLERIMAEARRCQQSIKKLADLA